jgi:hypothetical protein
MTQIYSETRPIAACTQQEIATFYQLLQEHFLGVTWEDFMHDFAEKEAVMILHKDDPAGDIVGWSTLMILRLSVQNETVMGVFSGDTVVLPQYRNSTGMGVELVRYWLRAYEQFPGNAVYYILISKGWRTYKMMPFFFRDFSPRYDRQTPTFEQAIIDAFGKTKYPEHYDPATGVITFSPQRVKPDGIDAAPAHPDAHATFFLQRNPGYLSGHELVCVARIAPTNFTPGVRRLVENEA